MFLTWCSNILPVRILSFNHHFESFCHFVWVSSVGASHCLSIIEVCYWKCHFYCDWTVCTYCLMEADTITPLCLVLDLPATRLKPSAPWYIFSISSFSSAPWYTDVLEWGKKSLPKHWKKNYNLSNCGLELWTMCVFTDEQHIQRKNNN